MKKNIILLFIVLYQTGTAQSLITPLFSDVRANGEVLVLDIKDQYESNYFIIGLVKNNQLIAQTEQYVRSGEHVYELRHLKEYTGKIDFIATSLPKQAFNSMALGKPTIRQEIDIVLAKSRFTPRAVNFVTPQKTFMGKDFILTVLIFTIIIFLGFRFMSKKKLVLAVFSSMLLGSIFFDLTTTMVAHYNIYQNTEQKYPYIDAIADTQKFIEKARPYIENGRWTFQGEIQDEYQKIYMQYCLAGIQYFPEGTKRIPKNMYIISFQQPKANQEILVIHEPYYLLKQN